MTETNFIVSEEEKISAMVSLLGDDSIKVRNRVATSLEAELPECTGLLQSILDKTDDPLLREKLNLILRLGSSDKPEEHWKIMKEHLAFNLRDGMIAISMLDVESHPTRMEMLRKLDELSEEWISELPEMADNEEKTKNLMEFLFKKKGFSGNDDDYYALDNCFLHRMLEKRCGLPVTLSVLSILLAEEAGLPLYGVGLPLHFIVGLFQGSKGIRFYDCYDSGREVTREECAHFLQARGIFFHPQLLSPCDPESTLQRILDNIRHISERKHLDEQTRVLTRFYASKDEPVTGVLS